MPHTVYAIYTENRKVIIMDRRVYEAVKKSEERSRRYKLNRQRQIRRRLLGLATALCLAVIIATGTHTLISSAHTATQSRAINITPAFPLPMAIPLPP